MERELETWASARRWKYVPVWDAMRTTFRGGGLASGTRYVTHGWVGTYGGMPCFGFLSGPGAAPVGQLQVIAVNVPGVRFPALTLREASFATSPGGVPLDSEFDLYWEVITSSERFAVDLFDESMRRELMGMVPDFFQLWFEHDAVLVSSLIPIEPGMIDRYLTFLRRLIDLIPAHVLAKLRAEIQPQRAAALAGNPLKALETVAPSRPLVAQRPALSVADQWRLWAQERGWLYAPNASNIVERYNHAPLPKTEGASFTEGFVGKFGDLPCFGWRSTVQLGERQSVRHALCVRRPGLVLKPVRITLEDPLLAELVGSGDIQVGDPSFDDRWRVTSEDPDFARKLLVPEVWSAFMEPGVPSFKQLWFERDVVAVITEGPIPPAAVDNYLRFLHLVLSTASV